MKSIFIIVIILKLFLNLFFLSLPLRSIFPILSGFPLTYNCSLLFPILPLTFFCWEGEKTALPSSSHSHPDIATSQLRTVANVFTHSVFKITRPHFTGTKKTAALISENVKQLSNTVQVAWAAFLQKVAFFLLNQHFMFNDRRIAKLIKYNYKESL